MNKSTKTRVINYIPMNLIQYNKENIEEIASRVVKTIKSGGVCILPFDTVYGFICDPKDKKAIEKIIDLKNRPEFKTFGLAVSDLRMLESIAQTNFGEFIEDKTPGKYTFIIDAKTDDFAPQCYKNNTLGIRIPKNALILEICKIFGPIAQTSANKSGLENCFLISEIKKQFDEELEKIDLIVDGGEIANGQPSQIWDLTGTEPREIER
jgi:tRNA threonylcarbamoyl adenosine modification protein (Sua5/YciO/YrdC/YwlC family)